MSPRDLSSDLNLPEKCYFFGDRPLLRLAQTLQGSKVSYYLAMFKIFSFQFDPLLKQKCRKQVDPECLSLPQTYYLCEDVCKFGVEGVLNVPLHGSLAVPDLGGQMEEGGPQADHQHRVVEAQPVADVVLLKLRLLHKKKTINKRTYDF